MDAAVTLDRVEFTSVKASAFTEWVHAEFFDTEGASALVEFTPGSDAIEAVATSITEIIDFLRGKTIADEGEVTDVVPRDVARLPQRHPTRISVSAVRTAITTLQALHNETGLTETLGGTPQESVELYANINRALLGGDRTPSGFARDAERAAARGFRIIKCAPFDEAQPSDPAESAQPGIDRVAAIREAIGPDVRVLVDCHSRFNATVAPGIAGELAKLDVGWFEEPVEPTSASDTLAEIASAVDIPVAGGESGYGVEFFEDLVEKGAVSVIMPDIKYCGGAAEARHAGMAAVAERAGFSLHSPSGPVSLLASAHVTASVPGAMALEHTINEAPWRADLLDPPERIEGGRLWFPSGFDVPSLNPETVSRYGRHWSP